MINDFFLLSSSFTEYSEILQSSHSFLDIDNYHFNSIRLEDNIYNDLVFNIVRYDMTRSTDNNNIKLIKFRRNLWRKNYGSSYRFSLIPSHLHYESQYPKRKYSFMRYKTFFGLRNKIIIAPLIKREHTMNFNDNLFLYKLNSSILKNKTFIPKKYFRIIKRVFFYKYPIKYHKYFLSNYYPRNFYLKKYTFNELLLKKNVFKRYFIILLNNCSDINSKFNFHMRLNLYKTMKLKPLRHRNFIDLPFLTHSNFFDLKPIVGLDFLKLKSEPDLLLSVKKEPKIFIKYNYYIPKISKKLFKIKTYKFYTYNSWFFSNDPFYQYIRMFVKRRKLLHPFLVRYNTLTPNYISDHFLSNLSRFSIKDFSFTNTLRLYFHKSSSFLGPIEHFSFQRHELWLNKNKTITSKGPAPFRPLTEYDFTRLTPYYRWYQIVLLKKMMKVWLMWNNKSFPGFHKTLLYYKSLKVGPHITNKPTIYEPKFREYARRDYLEKIRFGFKKKNFLYNWIALPTSWIRHIAFVSYIPFNFENVSNVSLNLISQDFYHLRIFNFNSFPFNWITINYYKFFSNHYIYIKIIIYIFLILLIYFIILFFIEFYFIFFSILKKNNFIFILFIGLIYIFLKIWFLFFWSAFIYFLKLNKSRKRYKALRVIDHTFYEENYEIYDSIEDAKIEEALERQSRQRERFYRVEKHKQLHGLKLSTIIEKKKFRLNDVKKWLLDKEEKHPFEEYREYFEQEILEENWYKSKTSKNIKDILYHIKAPSLRRNKADFKYNFTDVLDYLLHSLLGVFFSKNPKYFLNDNHLVDESTETFNSFSSRLPEVSLLWGFLPDTIIQFFYGKLFSFYTIIFGPLLNNYFLNWTGMDNLDYILDNQDTTRFFFRHLLSPSFFIETWIIKHDIDKFFIYYFSFFTKKLIIFYNLISFSFFNNFDFKLIPSYFFFFKKYINSFFYLIKASFYEFFLCTWYSSFFSYFFILKYKFSFILFTRLPILLYSYYFFTNLISYMIIFFGTWKQYFLGMDRLDTIAEDYDFLEFIIEKDEFDIGAADMERLESEDLYYWSFENDWWYGFKRSLWTYNQLNATNFKPFSLNFNKSTLNHHKSIDSFDNWGRFSNSYYFDLYNSQNSDHWWNSPLNFIADRTSRYKPFTDSTFDTVLKDYGNKFYWNPYEKGISNNYILPFNLKWFHFFNISNLINVSFIIKFFIFIFIFVYYLFYLFYLIFTFFIKLFLYFFINKYSYFFLKILLIFFHNFILSFLKFLKFFPISNFNFLYKFLFGIFDILFFSSQYLLSCLNFFLYGYIFKYLFLFLMRIIKPLFSIFYITFRYIFTSLIVVLIIILIFYHMPNLTPGSFTNLWIHNTWGWSFLDITFFDDSNCDFSLGAAYGKTRPYWDNIKNRIFIPTFYPAFLEFISIFTNIIYYEDYIDITWEWSSYWDKFEEDYMDYFYFTIRVLHWEYYLSYKYLLILDIDYLWIIYSWIVWYLNFLYICYFTPFAYIYYIILKYAVFYIPENLLFMFTIDIVNNFYSLYLNWLNPFWYDIDNTLEIVKGVFCDFRFADLFLAPFFYFHSILWYSVEHFEKIMFDKAFLNMYISLFLYWNFIDYNLIDLSFTNYPFIYKYIISIWLFFMNGDYGNSSISFALNVMFFFLHFMDNVMDSNLLIHPNLTAFWLNRSKSMQVGMTDDFLWDFDYQGEDIWDIYWTTFQTVHNMAQFFDWVDDGNNHIFNDITSNFQVMSFYDAHLLFAFVLMTTILISIFIFPKSWSILFYLLNPPLNDPFSNITKFQETRGAKLKWVFICWFDTYWKKRIPVVPLLKLYTKGQYYISWEHLLYISLNPPVSPKDEKSEDNLTIEERVKRRLDQLKIEELKKKEYEAFGDFVLDDHPFTEDDFYKFLPVFDRYNSRNTFFYFDSFAGLYLSKKMIKPARFRESNFEALPDDFTRFNDIFDKFNCDYGFGEMGFGTDFSDYVNTYDEADDKVYAVESELLFWDLFDYFTRDDLTFGDFEDVTFDAIPEFYYLSPYYVKYSKFLEDYTEKPVSFYNYLDGYFFNNKLPSILYHNEYHMRYSTTKKDDSAFRHVNFLNYGLENNFLFIIVHLVFINFFLTSVGSSFGLIYQSQDLFWELIWPENIIYWYISEWYYFTDFTTFIHAHYIHSIERTFGKEAKYLADSRSEFIPEVLSELFMVGLRSSFTYTHPGYDFLYHLSPGISDRYMLDFRKTYSEAMSPHIIYWEYDSIWPLEYNVEKNTVFYLVDEMSVMPDLYSWLVLKLFRVIYISYGLNSFAFVELLNIIEQVIMVIKLALTTFAYIKLQFFIFYIYPYDFSLNPIISLIEFLLIILVLYIFKRNNLLISHNFSIYFCQLKSFYPTFIKKIINNFFSLFFFRNYFDNFFVINSFNIKLDFFSRFVLFFKNKKNYNRNFHYNKKNG